MRFLAVPSLVIFLASAALADDWSHKWTVEGKAEIHADVADGRIEVRPGPGNSVEAHVTTEGWRIRPSEVTISEHQTGNRVELQVRLPHRNFDINLKPRWIHVELRVPVNAYSDLRTGDGAIQIDDIKGSIRATTGDGSIEAHGIEGSLEARTGDGHMNIRGRLDALDLNTGDGSIEAEILPGSHLNSGWRVHTGDGHVTLRLPADLRATLDAHTGDGSVTVDLPIAIEGTGHNKNEVRGKINGGGEILTIRTGDGSIHVQKS
jgi:hypothetical protein